MKKLWTISIIALMALVITGCGIPSNEPAAPAPQSTSGVQKVSVKVEKGSDGMTTEQRNIADRLKNDNKPGSIKHLYVISAYSGQVIIYSTVRGKVTSSGKRLTPNTVAAGYQGGEYNARHYGIPVDIGGEGYRTGEVLQDDGTYGTSDAYIYWWDTKGIYHQHYVSGGQIIHVADQPMNVKSIIINMSTDGK